MNVVIIYFLKVIAIQAILYLLYILAFHKSGRHAINRFYLILALVGSFIIPLISIPNLQPSDNIVKEDRVVWYELTDLAEFSNTNTEFIPVEKLDHSDFTGELVIFGMSIISLFLLIKLIYSQFQLLRLRQQSEVIIKDGYKVYYGEVDTPFSYFNTVFIPECLLSSSSLDTIMQHEFMHIKKKHSIDRVFVEVILSVFWFNPFHYLFRNRLIEVHEFQADEEVISGQTDAIAYQEILFQQISTQKALASANYFKLNTIKTRIKMMNKSKKLSKWIYLSILPLLALLVLSFSSRKETSNYSVVEDDLTEFLDYNLEKSNLYIPSIQPIKNTDLVRLTSAYGKRMHPILKVERMHEGVDFSTPVGSPVMATANGIVSKIQRSEEGFGNFILIDHNGMYKTLYAQLSEIRIKEGQDVELGEVIALSGNSGTSTGPHLHYEVRNEKGEPLDPLDFIKDFDYHAHNTDTDASKVSLRDGSERIKVVIDPGHGGKDKGITSFDLLEKEVNLKVAEYIAENFNSSEKVEIVLTREGDNQISLEDRINYTKDADLFISLHVETHEYKDEGRMLAIYNDLGKYSSKSKFFSDLLANEMKNVDKTLRVGYSSGYYVLKNAQCPAVLVSMGYFSNPESEKYLNSKEGMTEIAQGISDAIMASL